MEKTALILAKHLKEEGVEYAYGIPGGEVLEIIEAFRQVGIQFILTKHEMGSGFMADADAQVTGKLGVFLSTVGPGLTNTVTPVANAYLDRTPLLVITGEMATSLSGLYTHQVIDQESILKPITKSSVTLNHHSASQVIKKTIDLAKEGIPGPVHLNVPVDIAAKEQTFHPRLERVELTTGPTLSTVETFKSHLEKAQKPVMLIGVGIDHFKHTQAIRKFADAWKIPVITTYKAKGVMPEDHPLSFGGTGLSPVVDKAHIKLLEETDLILTVGFDPVELRADWNLPWEETVTTLNIEETRNVHHLYHIHENYIGDTTQLLNALMEGTKEKWKMGELEDYKESIQQLVKPQSKEGLNPYDVIASSRKLMPRETYATVDTGSHRILLNHVWESYEPRMLLQSNGLGTMGYGLPAAAGIKVAQPEAPVICFTGDAGIDMISGELQILKSCNLPVIVVVFRDETLSLIKLKQERMQYENNGCDFGSPDYVKLAQAYGGEGVTVRNIEEFEDALEEAQERDRFTIIDAVVNPSEYRKQM
jgi:acetolactate synthase-1/2/3 large subunit